MTNVFIDVCLQYLNVHILHGRIYTILYWTSILYIAVYIYFRSNGESGMYRYKSCLSDTCPFTCCWRRSWHWRLTKWYAKVYGLAILSYKYTSSSITPRYYGSECLASLENIYCVFSTLYVLSMSTCLTLFDDIYTIFKYPM